MIGIIRNYVGTKYLSLITVDKNINFNSNIK